VDIIFLCKSKFRREYKKPYSKIVIKFLNNHLKDILLEQLRIPDPGRRLGVLRFGLTAWAATDTPSTASWVTVIDLGLRVTGLPE
jgi:hypothetical protein